MGQGPLLPFCWCPKKTTNPGALQAKPYQENRLGTDKENKMICHICGGELEKVVTNLPFKINHDSIMIVKGFPILQCVNCIEYVIEDEVMQKVDNILNRIDATAELEVLNYAV